MQSSIVNRQSQLVLSTWQEAWHLHIESKYQGKTLAACQQHIRVFDLWHSETFGGSFNPQDLTTYALLQYRKHSLDVQRIKPATWNARLWALTILCEWIGKPELVESVEGKDYKRRSTKHRSLTEQETHRFVNEAEANVLRSLSGAEKYSATRDWACASLCLQAGLRVEEVTLLDVSDITINERSGSVRVRNGKGSKERLVPLNLSVRRALQAWNELRTNATATALFMGDGKNERITTRTIQRAVACIGECAGIAEVTPHWLRYTFAKRAERNGTSLADISDLLGHESIETTRRYLRSSLADLQSAVEE